MNLPHLSPIKFAQKVIQLEEKTAQVLCCFPQQPTLAMYYEAAAQSSACFSTQEKQMGFVISVKALELLEESLALEVMVELKQEVVMGALREFSFEIKEQNLVLAKGIVTIMLQGVQ